MSKKKIRIFFVILLLIVFWFSVLFFGSFFASSYLFLTVAVVISILVYKLVKRFSTKAAVIVTLITILVLIFTFISNFEEDYCWRRGKEVDNTGSRMVIATKEDAEVLKGFSINEGSQIGVSFRAHMLCHNTFNFTDAVKENYLFTK